MDIDTLIRPDKLAVLPEKIPFIKPRLSVETGDGVNIGSPLFYDKRNPDFKFLSPGGGKIVTVNYGPRRVIREIVIALDREELFEEFPIVSEEDLETIDRSRLIRILLDGGMWPLIRALPFRDIAGPDVTPPAIIVSLDAQEPFQAQPAVYLKENIELFKYGIRALRKLADNQPFYIASSKQNAFVLNTLSEWVTHTVEGAYPADDPGVLLYHIKKTSSQNRSWYINGQDVLLIGQLLKTGRYPTKRTVAVAGSSANQRKHFITRLGTPLKSLTQGTPPNGDARWIAGGLFRGYATTVDAYLGFYETSLLLIPQGKQREFMTLFNPGFGKPSYSRVFLSHLNRSELTFDCNRHGDERACIGCMHCADVCPVDILPQMAYKAILAEEVEEYLDHGLLDCVECGLCSYVCPAKIELSGTFKSAKAAYAKEVL